MLSLQIFEVRYLDLIKRCHQQGLAFGVIGLKKGSEVQVRALQEYHS
jgi:Lon protease-like protein